MTIDRVISESRECASCGYELRGLSVGGNCPECGEPIRPRRALGPREGQLTDAPRRYVNRLRIGFVSMAWAVAIPWASLFFGWILVLIFGDLMAFLLGWVVTLSGLAWVAGVWLITGPRPAKFAERKDAVLDSGKVKVLLRAVAISWASYLLLSELVAVPGIGMVALVLALLAGLGAFIGMIPMCIYLADMAFWMSNDAGAWRLRASAWTMAVFGSITVLGLSAAAFGSGLGALLAIWTGIVTLIAALVFLYSVFECARAITWAMKYQHQTEGRQERINKRIEARMTKGDVVTSGIVCRKCGYDLDGLPFGGHCPECGLSYADATPLPVRRAPSRMDDTPIDLGDGPTEAIIHKKPSIANPRGGLPVDDSPIPLAGDDEPRPDSEIDDRLDRLSD